MSVVRSSPIPRRVEITSNSLWPSASRPCVAAEKEPLRDSPEMVIPTNSGTGGGSSSHANASSTRGACIWRELPQ
jgi:hypothetical protein